MPAHAWVYLFHLLFYSVFIPRRVSQRKQAGEPAPGAAEPPPVRGAPPAPAGSPMAAGPAQPEGPPAQEAPVAREEARAPHAGAVLFVHMIGFFLMYFGIGMGFNPELRPFFPPQRLLGALVMLAAAGLAGWAVTYFQSWRIRAAVTSGHQLATGGPFAHVRHPIYLAMVLLALGTLLWIPDLFTVVGVVVMLIGGDLRGRAEERLLLRTFGDSYRTYLGRVKRFVPGVY